MKLIRKGYSRLDANGEDVVDIREAAQRQFITDARDASGPTEASEKTSLATANALALLISVLHERGVISNDDVLDLLHEYGEKR